MIAKGTGISIDSALVLDLAPSFELDSQRKELVDDLLTHLVKKVFWDGLLLCHNHFIQANEAINEIITLDLVANVVLGIFG